MAIGKILYKVMWISLSDELKRMRELNCNMNIIEVLRLMEHIEELAQDNE